jgi:hypothetical protein
MKMKFTVSRMTKTPTEANSDGQGFAGLAGLRERVSRVRVRVGLFQPAEIPCPYEGSAGLIAGLIFF